MVHRDLTPSNTLVTADSSVKLIDFGIARPTDAPGESANLSSARSLASLSLTPGFAAPERHLSNAATTSADIYSLGKLLERLLPDHDDAELTAIIAKASAIDPAVRYPTVEALAGDLSAWENNRPVTVMGDARLPEPFVQSTAHGSWTK